MNIPINYLIVIPSFWLTYKFLFHFKLYTTVYLWKAILQNNVQVLRIQIQKFQVIVNFDFSNLKHSELNLSIVRDKSKDMILTNIRN